MSRIPSPCIEALVGDSCSPYLPTSLNVCCRCLGGLLYILCNLTLLALPAKPFDCACRQRRCIACLHITNSMVQMRAHTAALIKSQSEQQCSADSYPATTADKQQDSCPASSSEETPVPTERQVLCMLKVLHFCILLLAGLRYTNSGCKVPCCYIHASVRTSCCACTDS